MVPAVAAISARSVALAGFGLDSLIEIGGLYWRAVVRHSLDTAAAPVGEHGLLSVTMSQIAEQTGIGRATLYKYFPDIDAILRAWHEREITGHLHQLTEIRDRTDGDPGRTLEAVLQAYAHIAHQTRRHHDPELVTFLHRDEHLAHAQHQLHDLIRQLMVDGAQTGDLRDDIAAGELASYCLHALNAASSLPSHAAVRRLVTVTMTGLRPPH